MKEILVVTPWLAFVCGAVMIGKALRLFEVRPGMVQNGRKRLVALLAFALAVPTLGYAQVDLKTSVESGNAIIMYLCGVFAAVGIVTAGVSMMAGRPTIAKWAFAGAMVSGLGFAVVKTMWSNFGLTPADVSTFTP
ncbi:MAG TPA: hypothetical protein VFT72_19050 [Opitutaceae bacterium]|nr:hypothetical protein [Opitutaceae bacterium]